MQASPSCQHFIYTPTTSKPPLFNRAAATELSTPPDMATNTFTFFFGIGMLYLKTLRISIKTKFHLVIPTPSGLKTRQAFGSEPQSRRGLNDLTRLRYRKA